MLLRKLIVTGALALPCLLLAAAQAPSRVMRLATPATMRGEFATRAPAPWAEDDPADSLYRTARQALNDEDFRRAARLFQSITDKYPRSVYAAEALYFRAFALYRSGRESDLRDALSALETHTSRFPKAKTATDAEQLATRINGELAKRGDSKSAEKVTNDATSSGASCDGEDRNDIRSSAISALSQMDRENAMPIIKQVLARRDACSASLRKNMMFVLSQHSGGESETLLIDAARSDPSQAVREQAIFWLGQSQSPRAAAILEDVALNSPDVRTREKAVFSLNQMGGNRAFSLLRRLAESSETPRRVRESAVFQLGQRSSSENAQYLKDLFNKLPRGNEELRKQTMFSLSQMHGYGNDRWLMSVALDESQSSEIRKHALFCAGQNGVSGRELVSMYDKVTDREVKMQVIWIMSDSRDPAASDRLVEIAKGDKDPEMRKKAIFWLGQKNDPRIKQILLDILK